jgi:uncharacterized protein (DUF433 family)
MSVTTINTKQYVEEREGCYRISGKRVSLDSIIYLFLSGASPESIVQSFPALTLEEVYGGITFYLANHKVINAYLEEGEKIFETLRKHSQETNPLFYQKLRDAQKA